LREKKEQVRAPNGKGTGGYAFSRRSTKLKHVGGKQGREPDGEHKKKTDRLRSSLRTGNPEGHDRRPDSQHLGGVQRLKT